jgi:hypothetical protein
MIVYRHIRLDRNIVFYIGIGKRKERAFSKKGRNEYWKRIVKKSDYTIEIIAEGLSYEEAIELEIFLISEYGRKDLGKGFLSNMTNGGEGCRERKMSEINKEKIRLANLGRKATEETKLKMSISQKGKNLGKKLSEEHKIKLSNIKKGKKPSQETRLKMGLKSKNKTEVWRKSMQEAGLKKRGIIFSEEHKKKLGISKMKKIINTKTGFIYDSLTQASIDLKTTKSTLGKKMNGQLNNDTYLKYL